jgi:hypothetical protein
MTSSASSAAWLPAAVVRTAVVTAPPARTVPTVGRHRAPVRLGQVESIATPEDMMRTGRHAQPKWSRELWDPERNDVDAFGWLGFADRH